MEKIRQDPGKTMAKQLAIAMHGRTPQTVIDVAPVQGVAVPDRIRVGRQKRLRLNTPRNAPYEH